MDNMRGILDTISDKLFANITISKVSDACYHSYHDVDIKKYQNYTISEFIQLYKINRMFELGAISEEEYNSLQILFNAKRKLDKKLGEELSKELKSEDIYSGRKAYTSKTKSKLHQEIERIKREFDKYSLNIDDINLESIINTIIAGEKYNNWLISDVEQLKGVAQETKKLKL